MSKDFSFNSYECTNITPINITISIKELVEGFSDNSETTGGGITTMNGKLNIRPKYQRAYVADVVKGWCEKLIYSILKGLPINRLYIGVDEHDNLEMLDGQQRTITIARYVNGKFAININGVPTYFNNLPQDVKDIILNYKIDATKCIGDQKSRVEWFKTINQPNSILTNQELRNSSYLGPWLDDAKRHFCANNAHELKPINNKENKYCITRYCTAKHIERCDFLEVALDWASYIDAYNGTPSSIKDMDTRICDYMARHQNDLNSDELIATYEDVVNWIVDTYWFAQKGYPSSQSFKNVDWVELYSKYGHIKLSVAERKHITERCIELVNNYKAFSKVDGVYEWVIRGEKEDEVKDYLRLRGFSKIDLDNMYTEQKGIDPIDGKHYDISEMHAHHIKSWRDNGVSDYDNLVWLSIENHRKLHAGDFGISSLELKRLRDNVRNS